MTFWLSLIVLVAVVFFLNPNQKTQPVHSAWICSPCVCVHNSPAGAAAWTCLTYFSNICNVQSHPMKSHKAIWFPCEFSEETETPSGLFLLREKKIWLSRDYYFCFMVEKNTHKYKFGETTAATFDNVCSSGLFSMKSWQLRTRQSGCKGPKNQHRVRVIKETEDWLE